MKIVICDDVSNRTESLKQELLSLPSLKGSEFYTYSSCERLLDCIISGENPDATSARRGISPSNLGTKEISQEEFEQLITVLLAACSHNNNKQTDSVNEPLLDTLKSNANLNKALFSLLEKLNKAYSYHTVKLKNGCRAIPVADIKYVECCQRHIIYYTDTASYETSETLWQVNKALKDFGFYQVHQGYIVNFDKIACFDTCQILLRDGTVVPVSRGRKEKAMEEYCAYMEKHYR